MTEYEKGTAVPAHSIKSSQCLVCAETGRVIAVFYNDYDLDEVLSRLTYRYLHHNVSCSSCGNDFGPGDHGFSHCESHKGMQPID